MYGSVVKRTKTGFWCVRKGEVAGSAGLISSTMKSCHKVSFLSSYGFAKITHLHNETTNVEPAHGTIVVHPELTAREDTANCRDRLRERRELYEPVPVPLLAPRAGEGLDSSKRAAADDDVPHGAVLARGHRDLSKDLDRDLCAGRGRGGLAGLLGRELLAGRLAAGRLAGGLLCASPTSATATTTTTRASVNTYWCGP